MGSYGSVKALEGGSVSERYDRLTSLLADHTPERLAVFWEGLPTMGVKRPKRPASETLEGIIKARIKSLELSAYAVAKRSGVNAVVIQRFLNGERGMNLATADKVCKALELVLIVRPDGTLDLDLASERHG